MRRFWRWTFNLAAAVSLAVCIFMIPLAVAIYRWHVDDTFPLVSFGRWISAAHTIEVSLVLPIIWLAVEIERRRSRSPGPDDCQHCGYNLTGNVSGICPECGAAISNEG